MQIKIIIITTYILNIIDYLFTSYWVNLYGLSIEANPIGRWMFSHNVAWVFKILIVGGLFVVLWYLTKRQPKAKIAGYVLFGVYSLIVMYHLVILFTI